MCTVVFARATTVSDERTRQLAQLRKAHEAGFLDEATFKSLCAKVDADAEIAASANLTGSGALAQGSGAAAAGEGQETAQVAAEKRLRAILIENSAAVDLRRNAECNPAREVGLY